jgi:4-hydroxythreonine-4-phosphate dehydrogenase
VALVTTHIPLLKVAQSITKKKLEQTIRTLDNDLKNNFKIKNPRITITGLNPHAGEEGEFGSEEKRVITPIIKKLIEEGLNLIGPIPADTAFTKEYIKDTDSFLAMYHDQGLAPFKALAFNNGVNTTLGLPIIRTSVDHGTALDIVGSKQINGSSFFESISLAIKLAKNKKK